MILVRHPGDSSGHGPGSASAGLACPSPEGLEVDFKPAEQSPLSALRAAELAVEAGPPLGVPNVVPGLGLSLTKLS
ncbi:aldehyde dehydrogenase family protein [Nonomuraea basaltis]|uniref:aldehyde dehydrogenase family protein n=1 Tax=Nonomuraea basaltis TaxID=2495887 RepID=UPI0023F30426|nr:aldehyde dehydrogenase family protein [Nonomuraea basaltis]